MKKKDWKHHKKLAMSISCALTLSFAPPLYGISYAAEVGDIITVDEGTIKETTADSSGKIINNYRDTTYKDVTIKGGGRWRPMDGIFLTGPYDFNGTINIDKLNIGSRGRIDLSWQETPNPVVFTDITRFRELKIKDATLSDGAVFRIGAKPAAEVYGAGLSNKITLGSDEKLVAGGGVVYIQLGNIMGFNPVKSNSNLDTFGNMGTSFLGIYGKNPGQFKVQGQAAYMDAPLNVYKVTPVIETSENSYDWWVLDPVSGEYVQDGQYTYLDATLRDYIIDNTMVLSESAKTAGDMQLAMRNLWRVENSNAFHHLDELHTQGNKNREGMWANTYGGKLTNSGSYGRSVSENYHGQQVGYDKQRAGDFYKGKLYTGLFFQQTKADIGIHTGNGTSDSQGFGTYATWVGSNGHYLDFMLRGSKLTNDYYFYNNGGKIDGANSAWAFGLNTRYGIHKPLSNGWFWEPQVGMAMGQIDKSDYTTSNGLQVAQNKVNVLTGQLGVLVGRSLGENKGNIYGKVTINHDFLDGGAMGGSYSDGAQAIETGANKDTWCELVVGANTKISPTGNFNLNLLHTFGGTVKTNWQVNGGFDWRWNGFGSSTKLEKAEMTNPATDTKIPPQSGVTKYIGNGAQIVKQQKTQVRIKDIPVKEVYSAPYNSDMVSITETDGSTSYVMDTVVVEGARPAWEEKLSPGTVTVIEPDKYKGEQKTLPDLLKEVPGVHVRQLNGIGQYTTVSVRGSSASQVGVFVDGVLSNLGGDAAVDISTIPIKNVARIEVYRGYVPARFGGTYMGGVINIVTKKPDKSNISASYGQRSWGGYTGSLQIDAPLKDGSLMVGINRDQSEGDFPYKNYTFQRGIGGLLADNEAQVASDEQLIKNGEMTPDNEDYIKHKKYLADLKNLSDTRYRMNNSYKNTDALIKWQNEHWMVKASWKQIDRLMVNKADSYYSDVPGADSLFPTNNMDTDHNPRREQKSTASDILIGRRDNSGNLEWGWNVNYLNQDKRYNNPSLANKKGVIADLPLSVWSNYHSQKTGASLDGTFKAGNHMLDFLLNVSKETMDVRGSKMDDDQDGCGYRFKNKYQQTLFNVQLQDNVTLNEVGDLWFTPSIRYNSSDVLGSSRFKRADVSWVDKDSGQKDGKTTWQLALKKKVNDSLTLRSSYGYYYRLLNLYEIAGDGAGILPRPKLNNKSTSTYSSEYPRPEEGMQWDVGASWKGKCLNANADISLTYFNRQSDNLLQLMRYGLIYWSYDNSAKGKVDGVELQSNFSWDKWDLNLNATHVNATRSVTDISPTGGGIWSSFKMTYTPEWEGRLRLTYRPNIKTALFTEINYTGEQYTADYSNSSNQEMRTALATVGLGCRYKMNKNSQLIIGVNDLFDKGPTMKNRQYYSFNGGGVVESMIDYPIQGRTYYATLHYDL